MYETISFKERRMNYSQLSRAQLLEEKKALMSEYERKKAQGLSLDLSRGKPGSKQLDLMTGMLDCISKSEDCRSEKGVDY